ncbi:helix-turn-helix domain-containing protein [Streptomyces sp. ADMS]|uniref:helix-turn-helix domain-containing protein n=1 Tax=Streptomyces sp. ADMS TaxID=3071415 RepID=UPI00296E43D2|nr:helix-turn-helix domain-containing protein [Streptomyces sp. ADMS]MDW4904132.1 helix-turn-helix domain-containing protein [Streptomyces sp. ADMS]
MPGSGADDGHDGVGGEPSGNWADELLDHLRPASRDLGRVTGWLAGTIEAEVSLQDVTGAFLAGTGVCADDELVREVATGRIASAAVHTEGRHVRLAGLGHPVTRGVLTVARTRPFDQRATEILARTVWVLELLLRERGTVSAERRLDRATSDLRLAILQLLMVGDIIAARRVAAGLWPGLFDTDTACVYVLEGHAAKRDTLAEDCQAAAEGHALIVRCPAVDEHLIVVAPIDRGQDMAGPELRSLVGERPDTFMGGSVRQSLAQTATAYGQAVSALAVARFRPDRAAVYAERTHPERLMNSLALRGWADRLLSPLDELPHHTRAELLATTRLGFSFTAVKTAIILGVSRNTVRARMERVEGLLDADFSDLTTRAAVQLALNTQASVPDGPRPALAPPAGLTELLRTDPLLSWADSLLDRLTADTRDLRRTVRTWIAAGGNAERTAQVLGIHAQTVRDHVRGAEPVLERELLAGGSDLYEVVLAHLALGDLDEPSVGRAKRDHPDVTVHE